MVDLLALLAGGAVGILLGIAVVGLRRGARPVVAERAPRRAERGSRAVVAPTPGPPAGAPQPAIHVNRPGPNRPGPAAGPAGATAVIGAPAAAAPGGPPRLEVEGGETVPLAGDPVTIGRGTDQRLRVEDSRASRAHAVVRPRAKGGWELADVGSANGTTLNGHRIPDGRVAPLRDGDRIGVGPATILYREGAGAPPPAGPDATQVL